jgi:hypothetical protein
VGSTAGGYDVRHGNIPNDHQNRESLGYAIVHAGGTETFDEVVFAEPGDTIALGARSLSGLNLKIDSRSKKLVDKGPIVAAVA